MPGVSKVNKLVQQEQAIQSLEAQNTVRPYTELIQGSIGGLIVGGLGGQSPYSFCGGRRK